MRRSGMGTRGAGMLLVVALAGCGQQGGDRVASTPEPPAPAAATPRPTSIPDELPEPLPAPGRSSGGGAAGQSLTGTVVPGVEAGCLLLSTPEGDYLLLGADASVVTAGARVTVRGRADPTLMTTCQQGTPFVVVSATPA